MHTLLYYLYRFEGHLFGFFFGTAADLIIVPLRNCWLWTPLIHISLCLSSMGVFRSSSRLPVLKESLSLYLQASLNRVSKFNSRPFLSIYFISWLLAVEFKVAPQVFLLVSFVTLLPLLSYSLVCGTNTRAFEGICPKHMLLYVFEVRRDLNAPKPPSKSERVARFTITRDDEDLEGDFSYKLVGRHPIKTQSLN